MRIILFLLLVPLLSLSQFAEKKIYNITKTTDKPKIDGVINEPLWRNINVADNFTQFKPNNGLLERSTHKTKVKICYDNQNLYFAAIMYDIAPDSILKELCKRDDDNKNNDRFTIVLDPFNNTQVEYNFTITASGVQIDKKMSKNGGDKSWNAVWRSAVDIFDKGWSVEIILSALIYLLFSLLIICFFFIFK